MNDSDKKAFAEMMVGNGELYNKEVTKSLMQTYFDILAPYTIEQVKSGVNKHALDPKHGTFFPKPADIIRHLETSDISTEDKALLAWAEVMQCLRKNGSYGGLQMEDKQGIAAFKAFTTWQGFCAMDESKMTWAKKEFMSTYSTYENTPLDMLPSSLPGLIELQNHKEEYAKKGVQNMATILDGINKHRLTNKD